VAAPLGIAASIGTILVVILVIAAILCLLHAAENGTYRGNLTVLSAARSYEGGVRGGALASGPFFVGRGHENLTAGKVVVEEDARLRSSRSVAASVRSSSVATRDLPESTMRDDAQARNEELFRNVNERIETLSKTVARDDPMMEYLCERDSPGCYERVRATRGEYESVRSEPTYFIVLAGHEDRRVERVAFSNERFLIVEKTGSGNTRRRGNRPPQLGVCPG
jgi:hypothetical protein